ncbi:MAG TPA: glucose-6-phosphate isomerase [Gemmatimonadaceae bacterium]|nr:glucose-6-phosphate isomerase [Gemmatimonadaceae bacterium]
MTIRLDYSHMLAQHVEGGLDAATWRTASEHLARALGEAKRLESQGILGFMEIVSRPHDLTELKKFADGVGQAFSDVVVLGIGGSALGTIALRSALRSPRWNELDDERREFYPRLHVLENVDPVTVGELLGRMELGRTLFIVISKSGGTAETMAQYLIVRERLERELGNGFQRHLVFITDPEKGALRKIAREERIVSLAIPPNVGGRFSVLSPVGLLPAALVGIDVDQLLEGAADMLRRGRNASLDSNPPGAYAVLQWLADTKLGLSNHVLMPYSDPLRDFSAWFVQLWAESLGKQLPDGKSVGPTPIAALGATDQHSQVQLFMEGPRDKTVTFIGVRERTADLTIPRLHADVPELAYLGGHTLGELLDVERRATAGALARAGRPNMTLEIERRDAWHVGALLMFFELATVYAGMLYGVDPLDQPGVELGKRFTYAMLERPDADAARREWASVPQAEPRWVE